ncbi:hypothetical protein BH09ACT7_BH09ACT7_34080 [soil metagenome]
MALHGRTDRLGDHQADPGSFGVGLIAADMHDQIGLDSPNPVLDRRTELRRPCHPVLRWEQRRRLPVLNQAVSERRPFFRRPDTIARPARVRIRSRKPCTRARRRLFGWKVRLPLATAVSPHCIWPSHPPRTSRCARANTMAVGKLMRLARNRRRNRQVLREIQRFPGSQPYRRRSGDCSRVLTCVRWVKPVPLTPLIALRPAKNVHCCNNCHASSGGCQKPLRNVAERLAPRDKTVSFSQCRFPLGTPMRTKRRCPFSHSEVGYACSRRYAAKRGRRPIHTCG